MKNAVSLLQVQPYLAISWCKMLYHNYKYNHIQQFRDENAVYNYKYNHI